MKRNCCLKKKIHSDEGVSKRKGQSPSFMPFSKERHKSLSEYPKQMSNAISEYERGVSHAMESTKGRDKGKDPLDYE